MKAASALLILLGVLSQNPSAWADVGRASGADVFVGAPMHLAQLSPEERRALRDQWGRMSPEERAALRRQFEERWRDIPPEQRESRRREVMDHWRNLPDEERELRRRDSRDRDGYGRGYEQRGFEDEMPPMPPMPPLPSSFPRRGGGR